MIPLASNGRTVIRLLVSRENIFHGNGNRRRFLAGCPNECSCGGQEFSSAIRLGSRRQARRTAPNSHADSGGPASQGRAAVPGTRPGRSRYSCVPSSAAIQKSDWLTPRGERPVRFGWRLGRIVRAKTPRITVAVWRGSGGRWDGHWPSPSPLGQPSAEPVCSPTHRRTAAHFSNRRGRNSRARPASPQDGRMPGRSLTPASGSLLP